jgi:phage terminase large subunit
VSALGSAVQHMRRWRLEPVAFVRECLKVTPDAWQVECLEALVRSGKKRFALKASKGPGKSTLLAWAIWWFLATRMHPKVVCTSVTEDNLRDGLWTELAKWRAQSPFLLAAFEWKGERITSVDHPETWWASARTWPKSGDSSQQANTLAGVHADNVMFVLDEAGGIPDAVAAAAEGGLANADDASGREALLLIAGNPTHLEGPLYRAVTSERALWWVKEISGDPDDPMRAPRVSIEWAREQIAKYGRDNPYVLVNVFGKFPPGSSNALFGPDEVAAAMKRVLAVAEYSREVKILGVDVARHGDDRTVIALRQGRVVFAPKVLRNLDTMQVAGQVALAFDKHKPDALFIDQATFGMGTLDRLVQLGYPAIGVDFAGKPVTHVKYSNRRAEMWFRLAEWVRDGGALPSMPELTSELTSPTYKFDLHNKLLLEKKAEIKKRTGVSPDIADAIALTFAQPVLHRELRDEARRGASSSSFNDYDPLEGA